MSLKCSLFGHRYGDTDVERDREQDGNELVERVRKVKICRRCGEELVISESKEVTTVEATDESAREDGDDSTTDTDDIDRVGGSGRPGGSGATASGGTGTTGGGPGTTGGDTGAAGPPGGGGGRAGEASDPPVTDPDPSAGGSAGHSSDGMDDRDIPPARKDDAVILGEDDEEDDDSPGPEWPDHDEGAEDDWEPDTEPEPDTGDEQPSASSGGLTVPEGEFRCPECGFTTAVEASSLREGDFCPECHRGALKQHDS